MDRKERRILLLEERMKRNALASFPYFVDKVLNYDHKWDIQPFQFEVMRQIQKYPELLVLLPRGHGKTELITQAYPIWRMCVNPNIKILLRNENSDNAEKYLAAIKDILEQNQLLITLFGEFKDDRKWSSDQIIIRQRTLQGVKDSTITASGLNKSVTGGHYNLIIDDDLVSDKNTETLDQINKVIDVHKKTPPLQDAADFEWIIIGTRYHYFDMYNHIMQNEPNFHVIQMSAINGTLDNGEILFPKLFTREKLIGIKQTLGSYIFSCQYMNQPVDDADAIFKHSWIEAMKEPYRMPDNINTFILVDPAISQEKRADSTSMLVASIDENKHMYIRQIIRDKLTSAEIIDNIFYLNAVYHPNLIGVEMNAYQKIYQFELEKEQQHRGVYLPFEGFSWHTNKQVRIRGLQPHFERGEIHVDKDLENVDYLEYELLRFPKGEHDDVIDTLASLLRIGFAPDESPKEETFEDVNAKWKRFIFEEELPEGEEEVITDLIFANEKGYDFFQNTFET